MGYSWPLLSCSGLALKVFWASLKVLLAFPELLWIGFEGVLGVSGGAFWLIFFFRRGLRQENFEMLVNNDLLIEFAVVSKPQGLQDEIHIDPETIKRELWRERGPESGEESDFGGKSRISLMLHAFQGGAGAEWTGPGGGNTMGSGAYLTPNKQTANT